MSVCHHCYNHQQPTFKFLMASILIFSASVNMACVVSCCVGICVVTPRSDIYMVGVRCAGMGLSIDDIGPHGYGFVSKGSRTVGTEPVI